MTQTVNVPGVGQLNFPDGMSQPDMAAAIQKNFPQIHQQQPSLGARALDYGKTLASAAVRPILKAATGPQLMVENAAVEGYNVIGNEANKLRGRPATPNVPLPSQTFEAGLNQVTRAPTSTTGRIAEDLSTLVAGGRSGGALARDVGLLPKARLTAEDIAKLGDNTKRTLIGDIRKLGLRLTSQDVGAPIGKHVEAVASRPQLEREISVANAPKVREAAAADVGIKEPLSAGSINKAITETLVPYKAPRNLGQVNLAEDTQWKADLKKIAGSTAEEELDYPNDVNESVQKEIAKFDVPRPGSNSMVNKIARLRERASDNFASGSADDKALARAQRALATAMEEAIERHGEKVGQGGLIAGFRSARTRLAKLYTLRDAMTESGELDLGVLEKRLDKAEPMTGNLRTLARAKSAFDRSFQNPDNIRGHPTGLADAVVGAVSGGAAGVHGAIPGVAVGAAVGAARPVTRAVMRSRPYQKAFIKPRLPPIRKHTLADLAIGGAAAAPTSEDQR